MTSYILLYHFNGVVKKSALKAAKRNQEEIGYVKIHIKAASDIDSHIIGSYFYCIFYYGSDAWGSRNSDSGGTGYKRRNRGKK